LSPEAIALAFFYNNISCNTKRKMISDLNQVEDSDEWNINCIRRIEFKIDDFLELVVKDFVFCILHKQNFVS